MVINYVNLRRNKNNDISSKFYNDIFYINLHNIFDGVNNKRQRVYKLLNTYWSRIAIYPYQIELSNAESWNSAYIAIINETDTYIHVKVHLLVAIYIVCRLIFIVLTNRGIRISRRYTCIQDVTIYIHHFEVY